MRGIGKVSPKAISRDRIRATARLQPNAMKIDFKKLPKFAKIMLPLNLTQNHWTSKKLQRAAMGKRINRATDVAGLVAEVFKYSPDGFPLDVSYLFQKKLSSGHIP